MERRAGFTIGGDHRAGGEVAGEYNSDGRKEKRRRKWRRRGGRPQRKRLRRKEVETSEDSDWEDESDEGEGMDGGRPEGEQVGVERSGDGTGRNMVWIQQGEFHIDVANNVLQIENSDGEVNEWRVRDRWGGGESGSETDEYSDGLPEATEGSWVTLGGDTGGEELADHQYGSGRWYRADARFRSSQEDGVASKEGSSAPATGMRNSGVPRRTRAAGHNTRRSRTTRDIRRQALRNTWSAGIFRCTHINVNGLNKGKEMEIKQILKDHQVDVAVLTETHNEGTGDWGGYVPFTGGDTDGFGGVIILAKAKLYAEELNQGEDETCQSVWIGIHGPDAKVAVGGVYIPPVSKKRKVAVVRQEFEAIKQQQVQMAEEGWEVMILGDLNAHLEEEREEDEGALPNEAGKCLKSWVEEENLHLVNYSDVCRGRWTRVTKQKKSMPDYIIVSERIMDNVEAMEIDEEGTMEVGSDHNWMRCDVAVGMRRRQVQKKKVWKLKEANWQEFEREMEVAAELWLQEPWEQVDLDERTDVMVQAVNALFKEVGEETVGTREVSGLRSTRGLDEEMTGKVRARKEACRAYRRARRLRNRGEMSETEVRRLEGIYEARRREIQEIWLNRWKREIDDRLEDFKSDKSGRTFWRWAKAKMRRAQEAVGLKMPDGRRIFNKAEIKRELERYYSDLCNPDRGEETVEPPVDEEVWEEYNGADEDEREEREQRDQDIMGGVTTGEILRMIKQLKRGKAAGLDDIPNEFLKHCGKKAIVMIQRVFNTCIEEVLFPKIWKEGRTSFIPKPGSDGRLDGMRGITINSSLGKLLLKIIWQRMVLDVKSRGLLGNMQHGFRRGYQAMDAVFILTQILEKRRRTFKKTAMAFIDIKKAYDLVDRDILWKVMAKQKFGDHLIGFLKEVYRGNTTRVQMNGIETDDIPINLGLKQGCPLSPLLFALYIQELSTELEESGEGVPAGPPGEEVIIPGLLFADDLVLLADSEGSLQRMLDIVGDFAKRRKMTLSPEKSKVLISWRAVDKKRKWKIGEHVLKEGTRRRVSVVIDEEERYKYLGVWVSLFGSTYRYQMQMMATKAGRYIGVVKNVWMCSRQSAWVGNKIWSNVAKPAILYGSEVLTANKEEGLRIERKQRALAKMLLKGRKGCSIAAMYGELGWRDIRHEMKLRMLRYCGRLWSQGIEEDRWCKKVFLEGLMDLHQGRGVSTWWCRIADLVTEYRLDLSEVDQARWQSHVDKKIAVQALSEWRREVDGKSTLRYYKAKEEPAMEEYLANNWRYRFQIFALRTGQEPLNWLRKKWRKDLDGKCTMCGQQEETEEHLLLRCTRLGSARDEILEILYTKLDDEDWEAFQAMDDSGKLQVVLGTHPGVRKALGDRTFRRMLEKAGEILFRCQVQRRRQEQERQ